MMWYLPLLPPLVEQSPSQIGMRTTLPCRCASSIAFETFFAQSLPLSTGTSTGQGRALCPVRLGEIWI